MRSCTYHIIAILIMVLCVSCSSCSVSTGIPRITSDVTVYVYKQGGIDRQLSFGADAPEIKELMAIVDAKQGKWRQDFITYAPAISIHSETLRLDCQRSRVIAIFRTATGGPIQMVAPLTESEYGRIQKMFGVAGDQKGKVR